MARIRSRLIRFTNRTHARDSIFLLLLVAVGLLFVGVLTHGKKLPAETAYADTPYSQGYYQGSYGGEKGGGGGGGAGSGSGSGSGGGGGSGSSGGSCCFQGDQSVETPAGPRPISELAIEDEVLMYDEENDEIKTGKITQVFVHDGEKEPVNNFEKSPLLRIVTEEEGKTMESFVTAEHPYYNKEKKSYEKISDLPIGSTLKTLTGTAILKGKATVIDASTPEKHETLVYNIHVEGTNNYFANGILVHNK